MLLTEQPASSRPTVAAMTIRRIDPPRAVEVWHDDTWVIGVQTAWIRQDDGSWKASVEYTVEHDWGRGKHVRVVGEDRVRLPE